MSSQPAPLASIPPVPLDTSSERDQALVDGAMDAFVTTTAVRDGHGRLVDFQILQANEAARECTQLSTHDLGSARLRDILPELVTQEVFDLFVLVVESGKPLHLGDLQLKSDSPGIGTRSFALLCAKLNDGVTCAWREVTRDVDAVSALMQSEEHFRLLAENSTDVVFLGDDNMVFRWVSPSIERTLGWQPSDLVGRPANEFIHPDDAEEVRRRLAAISPGAPLQLRNRLRHRNGGYRWMAVSGRGFIDAQGQLNGRLVSMRDIDEQVEAEHELTHREERYRLLAEHILDVVYQADLQGIITWVSPSVTEALGWQPTDLVGTSVTQLIHPDDLEQAREARLQALASGQERGEVEARFQTISGTWIWMRAIGQVIRDASGQPTGGIQTLRDIQAEVDTREQLDHERSFDRLTGLPNRGRALLLMTELHAECRGEGCYLLCIGVDALAEINRALTNSAGDRVLVAVSQGLVAAVGDAGVVARTGGNEFLVILPNVASHADVIDLALQLQDAVNATVTIGDHDITVTVSIGIAEVTGGTEEELLRDAAAAVHLAKASGRQRLTFSDPALSAEALERITANSGLREAMAAGELQPWFQPIVDIATRQVRGFEALARWRRRDGTLVSAEEFIAVAERIDQIITLDRLIVQQAMAAAAMWPKPWYLAANISAATLRSDNFAVWVAETLAVTGFDPARLHLEVTETALFRITTEIQTAMRDLATFGITWWADDFGTGYSSVAHLRDLPIQGLKLDRSFTADLDGEEDKSGQLARGLIGLARGLELRTVAEGVETERQAEILQAQGWELGQGWLFGRPVPHAGQPHPQKAT